MNTSIIVQVSETPSLPARLTLAQAVKIAEDHGFVFEKADKGKGYQMWSNELAPGVTTDYDTINCDDARSDLHDLLMGRNPMSDIPLGKEDHTNQAVAAVDYGFTAFNKVIVTGPVPVSVPIPVKVASHVAMTPRQVRRLFNKAINPVLGHWAA